MRSSLDGGRLSGLVWLSVIRENVIACTVLYFGHGDGTSPMGKPGFIFKLDIEMPDGTASQLISDDNWQSSLAVAGDRVIINVGFYVLFRKSLIRAYTLLAGICPDLHPTKMVEIKNLWFSW